LIKYIINPVAAPIPINTQIELSILFGFEFGFGGGDSSDILIVGSWMNLRICCFHSTGNNPCRQVGVERRILLNDSISRDKRKQGKVITNEGDDMNHFSDSPK
jgi:hypothetical protein